MGKERPHRPNCYILFVYWDIFVEDDMLRFLEHGIKIRMQRTIYRTHAVDVPGDVAEVERLMKLATA